MEIDLLGQYYTAINNEQQPGVFAISVHLTKPVNSKVLQNALNDLMTRLPFLNSRVKAGFFSYQLEQLDTVTKVESNELTPLFSDYYNHGSRHIIKVVYGQKNFTVKATHSICDGRGLSKITIALLTRYFELLGLKVSKQGIIDCEKYFQSEEAEDGVKLYMSESPKENKKKEDSKRKVYQTQLSRSTLQNVYSETFDVNVLKKESQNKKMTLSQYLFTHIFSIIKKNRDSEGGSGEITGSLQIDCRTFFPSNTLRSFVTAKNITMPETYNITEQTRKIKQQFQEITKEYVHRKLYEQQKMLQYIRFMPLIIKDMIMKKLSHIDAARTTTGLSNLGLIKLPSEIEAYVEHLEFPIAIEKGISQFFSCVTVGNKLTLTATFFEEGRNIVEEVMETLREVEHKGKIK